MKIAFLLITIMALHACVGPSDSFPSFISHGVKNNPANPASSTPGNPYANDPNSAKRGKDIYVRLCSRCHGDDGSGNGLEAKPLNLKPANLRVLRKDFPDYYLFHQIAVGREKMPSWKDILSDQQMWDLVSFISKEM